MLPLAESDDEWQSPGKISVTIPTRFTLQSGSDYEICLFNINGLRARPHQLEAIVEKHQPDVIGLQETKVHDEMFPLEEVAKLGYNVFYHGQKGHYGVALLTKPRPFPSDAVSRMMAKRRNAALSWRKSSPLGNITVINGYFPQESRDHPLKFPRKRSFTRTCKTILKRNSSAIIRY